MPLGQVGMNDYTYMRRTVCFLISIAELPQQQPIPRSAGRKDPLSLPLMKGTWEKNPGTG